MQAECWVFRLLAKTQPLGRARTHTACRLHTLPAELVPGGIANEVNASAAQRILDDREPSGPVQATRHTFAVEHLEELRRLDVAMRESKRRIADAVTASGSTLTELFGVGPVVAGMVIGYSGDAQRFGPGTAAPPTLAPPRSRCPVGGRIVHRLTRRGNRQLDIANR